MTTETYFLSSLESTKFSVTRECVFQKRLRFRTGKECVLVKVTPPVIGQEYGIGEDIDFFVITNRHEGMGLSPIKEFPCFVFIARPLIDDIEAREEIGKEDVEVVAWGELYRTKADADQHVFDQAAK
jgi:hypothetical protein